MSATQGAQRATLPAEGFVGRDQLLEVVPFSARTLNRLVADGSFPRPVRVSKRLNGWNVRDIRSWMEATSAQA